MIGYMLGGYMCIWYYTLGYKLAVILIYISIMCIILQRYTGHTGNLPPSITGDSRVNASIGKWVITSVVVSDTDAFTVTFSGGSQMPRNFNFTETTKGKVLFKKLSLNGALWLLSFARGLLACLPKNCLECNRVWGSVATHCCSLYLHAYYR